MKKLIFIALIPILFSFGYTEKKAPCPTVTAFLCQDLGNGKMLVTINYIPQNGNKHFELTTTEQPGSPAQFYSLPLLITGQWQFEINFAPEATLQVFNGNSMCREIIFAI